jgi:hypothetical protein
MTSFTALARVDDLVAQMSAHGHFMLASLTATCASLRMLPKPSPSWKQKQETQHHDRQQRHQVQHQRSADGSVVWHP